MGSMLIAMVNRFMDLYSDSKNLSHSLSQTAVEFNRTQKEVIESVFPYVDTRTRNQLFTLRNQVAGIKLIYCARVRSGLPASRMSKYGLKPV